MKVSACLILIFMSAGFAGHSSVDLDPVSSDGDWLEYDDGSPGWYSWGGTYRGVWFNIQDFIPGMTQGFVWQTEFWFYHEETSHPWDTSDAYAELWNGDAGGPLTQIHQQIFTALDYAPVYVEYLGEAGEVEQNFWAMANVEMSAGGWPSILLDDQGSAVSHSFLSDDLIVWEPYVLTSGKIVNYIVAVEWNSYPNGNSFESFTWGALKTAF